MEDRTGEVNEEKRELTMISRWIAVTSCLVLLLGCGAADQRYGGDAASSLAAIDGARIAAADDEPGSWLAHGRTYDEQRFSPLDQINDGTVAQLGPVWTYDTDGDRGHEATPIVVDGRMYLTASWSVVHALDARTGEQLWKYDPQVPGEVGRKACCDVVNRGVAVWQGRVYVAALDGRLIALDAGTGEPVWDVRTTDPEKPYTITGAPRIVKGKVIIGNGGAEYGVRGYVFPGRETGGFLTSVFGNDFAGAMTRTGLGISVQDLGSIARFLHNDVPPRCWGSPEKVAAWVDAGGLEGTDSK